jgi:hypothetical protein
MNKQDKEIILDLKQKTKNGYDKLAMTIRYYLGGYNYFSGDLNARGYRLSFTPCSISAGMRSCTLMSADKWESGFYLFLEDATRFNAKRLDYWYNKIKPLSNKLRELFESRDGNGLNDIINKLKAETPDLSTDKIAIAKPERKGLLTDKLIKRFKEIGDQSEQSDPLIVAKFFNACGAGTWYATEYNEKDQVFYGYVSLFGDHNDEWGDFGLAELEEIPTIEFDRHFGEKRFSEIKS